MFMNGEKVFELSLYDIVVIFGLVWYYDVNNVIFNEYK